MLPYISQVAGLVPIIQLYIVKATIAHQVFNWLVIIIKLPFILPKLLNSPEVIAAQQLDYYAQHITRKSVWLCLQMTLLAALPWENTGLTELVYNYLVCQIVQKHHEKSREVVGELFWEGGIKQYFTRWCFARTPITKQRPDQSNHQDSGVSSKNPPHIRSRQTLAKKKVASVILLSLLC